MGPSVPATLDQIGFLQSEKLDVGKASKIISR